MLREFSFAKLLRVGLFLQLRCIGPLGAPLTFQAACLQWSLCTAYSLFLDTVSSPESSLSLSSSSFLPQWHCYRTSFIYLQAKCCSREKVYHEAVKRGDGRTDLKICSKKARSSGVYGIKKKDSGLSEAWRVGKGN